MFQDREDAALKLSFKLINLIKEEKVVIVALAKGGVPLGKIIAGYFNCPLNVLIFKKIGAPLNKELAIGAIGPQNVVFWNEDLIKRIGVGKKEKEKLRREKEKERKEQENLILKGKKQVKLLGKTAILVDDGVATGASVLAAVKYLEKQKVKKTILAVPVISRQTYFEIKKYFDLAVVLKKEKDFYAVGQFYKNFSQIDVEEVKKLLSSKT